MGTLRVNNKSQTVDFILENHGNLPILVGRRIEANWIVKSRDLSYMASGQWGDLFRDGLELLPPPL